MGDGKKDGGKRLRPKALPPEHWKDEPEEHDFPAAANYLSLLADGHTTEGLVAALRSAHTSHGKAKDLLRASRLPLLDPDNAEVISDLDKVRHGERLSPVLLVRGTISDDTPLTFADGYSQPFATRRWAPATDGYGRRGTPVTAAKTGSDTRVGSSRPVIPMIRGPVPTT
jgi:hypothetical protein